MTKLEDIARAICCPGHPCKGGDRVQQSGLICESASYTDAARAAVEAMREPTEAMIEAGHASGDWGPGSTTLADNALGNYDADAKTCFQAMIDAILNEKPST
jgi:hypothetical protein